MASRTRPVPSKDALRALRNIALSPSTAILGALGSACSLAAVHYQACQRLRIADQILDTKRTLHTLSNGKGVKQLNLMIEAAERGDDFTLHHGRPMKTQRRRSSAMAVARTIDEASSHGTFPGPTLHQAAAGAVERTTEQCMVSSLQQSRPTLVPDQPTYRARHIQRNSEKLSMLPRNFKNIAIQSLKKRQEQRWRIMMNSKAKAGQISEHKTPIQQGVTDLHPAPTKTNDAESVSLTKLPPLSSEESLFFNFVFGKQSGDDVFNSNIFQTMHPWSEVEIESEVPSQEKPPVHDSANYPTDKLPIQYELDQTYIAASAPVPDVTFSHDMSSRYHSRDDNILHVAHTGAERYYYIFNSIAQTIHDSGKREGFARFERALATYTRTTKDKDLMLVKLLILEFTHVFESKDVLAAIRKIVREKLHAENPLLQFVSLLYPNFGDISQRSSRYAPFIAMRYLEEFCQLTPNTTEQKAELIKVIEGTRLCKVELSEQLLLPLLRFLCTRGEVKQAQDLLDEIQTKYDIKTTLYTQTELMRGYAASGNWWKVKNILYQSHADDVSWKRVHGYAGLFVRSLDQHMSSNTIEKSCAFVMHAIDNAGLYPTSVISNRIIMGCLREKRYDLLRQYVNMVQRDFPFLDLGTNGATFASDVAAVWQEINATSEDILQGCKAIAVNALRDPFSKAFRNVVSEAVARELQSRIEVLEGHGASHKSTIAERPSVSTFTESIRELVKHHRKVGFNTETRQLAADLVRQTKTVMQLEELLNGSYLTLLATKESHTEQSTKLNPVKVSSGGTPKVPPGLKALRLPAVKEVVSMLQKFYESRHNRDLPIDHSVSQYVCNRLSQQSRHSDAFAVLDAVFNSEWVQPPNGKPFDLALFVQWLRLALKIRSGGKVKDVLWAVVESSSTLEVSTELLLLAQIALPRTHYSVYKQARNGDIDEAQYLFTRLQWRRAQELRKTGHRNITFGEWPKMGTI